MTRDLISARDRLVTTALRVAQAEWGGMDHANSAAELELAHDMLNEAAKEYVAAANGEDQPDTNG